MGLASVSYPAIKLDNLSVYYRFEHDRPTSMKEFVIRKVKNQIERQTIQALDGISLEVCQGEVFGVIGRNGAGKSTLLRSVARIIRPTKGRIRVWGQVSSLLSVGAGFSQELTGRENIYLYSALLGRSQEQTKELLHKIIDFAEIDEFIDSPLRTYSSGMIARLGFAVAMAEIPEILLVDEVLAVGDEQFVQKCQNRFQEIQTAGTTIIIVSHSMNAIQDMCTRVLWLEEGRTQLIDRPGIVIDAYRASQLKVSP
jgi:ABC-type polysaccharide/polyol phosphate transport system ATPase subunit